MSKAIVVHELGGPEVLKWEEVPDAAPGPGQARVRHTAIGVNFVDVYFRNGIYKAPAVPFVPGHEAAGVVEAIGPDVTEVEVGDRVAYSFVQGSYAESAQHPGRAAGAVARRHRRPHGGGDHAQGDVGAISPVARRTGQARRHHPVSRGRRRRRAARLPVGQAPGRQRDRHRQHPREGAPGVRERLRARHQLRQGELRASRARDHPRRRGRGRVRLGG